MNCPNCGHKINVASELGKLGKGKRKKFSKAEIKRRTERLLTNRFKPPVNRFVT